MEVCSFLRSEEAVFAFDTLGKTIELIVLHILSFNGN